MPDAPPPLMPTKINPTCAMDEKARNLFIFCCLMAKRFPITIEAIDKMTSM